MDINLLDYKILCELGIDSRQTNSQIGKKIGTSQQVVSYRIKQLIKKGIIKEFFTVIHFGSFKLSNYIAMVKLQNTNNEERKNIIKSFYGKKDILLISECGGKWDLIINIISDSHTSFQEQFSKIIEEYSSNILNYDLFISLGGANFGRKYIFEQTKNQRKTVFFGKEKIIKISDSELKILKSISKNARKSAVVIGSETGINYKTVIQKIEKLKKCGVISGFRLFIDISKIGYFASKIYLNINKITNKEEDAFTQFLSLKKNAIGILKMIGKYNFCVTIETKTQEEVWNLYKQIQDYLGIKITSMQLVPIFKKHEYRYFPQIMLK